VSNGLEAIPHPPKTVLLGNLLTLNVRTPVQDLHLVRERGDEVWRLLESGAVVFVCGDPSRMAPDVRRSFTAIYRDRTGTGEAAAEAWLDGLTAQGRYLVDVWASV
jgi:sulfite reductase alpha subunit-like flavoprotein